jgi:3',5'-cyclic AMP phosphodiesterase CpdA
MEATPSDFLVNTGDMVARGNDPAEWSQLFSIEGPMLRDRCAFVAVGNHELSRGDRAGAVAFLHYFAGETEGRAPERLYSTFRWSNARFFVLNAMDDWTGDERAWLFAELDRAAAEPGLAHRIAVMHWGPYSSGHHGNNPALANGEVVDRMRARGVDLILAGHDHAYERGESRGLKYVISGGAGAPLYPKEHDTPETRRYEATYHFVEVAVDGDRVRTTAHLPAGGVLEACGFQGMGSWDCDAKR